jgi:hypothetical protein
LKRCCLSALSLSDPIAFSFNLGDLPLPKESKKSVFYELLELIGSNWSILSAVGDNLEVEGTT